MEEEDEENLYAPAEVSEAPRGAHAVSEMANVPIKREGRHEDEDGEEEGEEVEEDESDSDIDIITERKGSEINQEPPISRRIAALKETRPATPSAESVTSTQRSPAVKSEHSSKETSIRPGSSYPAIKTSTLNVDTKPIYEPNGKPITEIDMDADFPEDDKPWRRPGTDMTDYFNYGFDEFTWASYCLKQGSLRKEVTDSKKQMEEMQSFLSMPSAMPGIPGVPGVPGGAPPGMPPVGGPADMPPEMQQMMAQMMAQGMDPTQIDAATFMQMMQGSQGAGGGGDPNQNFGGQGFGQQAQNQQMGYGYGGGGGGGRNQGARGNRRW